MFSPLAKAATVLAASLSLLSPVHAASTCNGSPDLCNRSFGNITFVGSHDSYAVGVNNLGANQDQNITTQLDNGIRMLQIQTHNLSGTIQLCHTNCGIYNGGTLQAYLTTVKSWLDANPNDVLSLLIVNNDNFLPPAYDSVFKAAGIDTMAYAPSSASLTTDKWPTLSSLIDSGKRLLTFMDYNADFTSVPYIIDEFSNIWETAYDVTTSFDCAVNRSKGDTSTSMYLINHFLDTMLLGNPVPDPTDANTTNAVSGKNSLGAQVQLCASQYGRNPNFMLVDFYEFGGGSVFQVAATANGVQYNPSTPVATPVPTSSSGSSSGGGSSKNAGVQTRWSAGLMAVSGVLLGTLAML